MAACPRFEAAAALACLLFIPGIAAAHDFWIEPSDFAPAAGSVVQVALRVGQNFEGDPVPRIPALLSRFIVAGPDGEAVVDGRDNQDPAGFARIGNPGTYVIGYRSLPSKVELDGGKFEQYLADEGLDQILALRETGHLKGTPGREIYSRCAKSIVVAGGPAAGSTGFDARLGFTLELIPEQSPAAESESRGFRLLYEGTPLEGARVVALSADAPGAPRKGRTDGKGRVAFKMAPGIWLVKSVHMIAAPKDSGADWESLWASLTLEIPAGGSGAGG